MKKNNSKGFMIIEVLVAASIITASMLATMAVVQKSVYVSRTALHARQAAFLLEEGAEAVRILRDNGWANISLLALDTDYYLNFQDGTWNISLTPSDIEGFSRVVRFAQVKRDDTTKDISEEGTEDPDSKLVTVTVSWVEGGESRIKTLQFYIMNIFS